jgi:hypothetical protein
MFLAKKFQKMIVDIVSVLFALYHPHARQVTPLQRNDDHE